MTEIIASDAQAAVEPARTATNQHPHQEVSGIETAALVKAVTRQWGTWAIRGSKIAGSAGIGRGRRFSAAWRQRDYWIKRPCRSS